MKHVAWHLRSMPRWLRGQWIGVTGNTISLDGCTFDVSASDIDAVTKAILAAGLYEADERSFLVQLPTDRPLVELGGCMGVISCLSNRRLADPTRHVVLEANPRMLPIIRENARLNVAQFHTVHAAVAYTDAPSIKFSVGRRVFANRVGTEDDVKSVQVPATTLRTVFDAAGFQKSISLICDIEGAEVAMIACEQDVFARVDWFMIEFHAGITGDDSIEETKSILSSVGLTCVERFGDTILFRRQ